MHKLWLLVPLLVMACEGKTVSVTENDLINVGGEAFLNLPVDRYMSVYGYLSMRDQGVMLFPNRDIAALESSLALDVSARVWLHENGFKDVCHEGYVVVKAKKFYYVGAASLDEVATIVSMENDELCYEEHDPINYFDHVLSQL